MGYLSKHYEIDTDHEGIRECMIGYHKEQAERHGISAKHAETKRDRRWYESKVEEHEGMVAFWESARFVPRKLDDAS